jgi:hypothetical protein
MDVVLEQRQLGQGVRALHVDAVIGHVDNLGPS